MKKLRRLQGTKTLAVQLQLVVNKLAVLSMIAGHPGPAGQKQG
ncbi:TPA: hypothetical protein ACYJH5_003985 [Salmonella enterica]